MSTAQETSNKATFSRLHDAMNTGDAGPNGDHPAGSTAPSAFLVGPLGLLRSATSASARMTHCLKSGAGVAAVARFLVDILSTLHRLDEDDATPTLESELDRRRVARESTMTTRGTPRGQTGRWRPPP